MHLLCFFIKMVPHTCYVTHVLLQNKKGTGSQLFAVWAQWPEGFLLLSSRKGSDVLQTKARPSYLSCRKAWI